MCKDISFDSISKFLYSHKNFNLSHNSGILKSYLLYDFLRIIGCIIMISKNIIISTNIK